MYDPVIIAFFFLKNQNLYKPLNQIIPYYVYKIRIWIKDWLTYDWKQTRARHY
jgi:hypothetical protein